MSYDPEMTLYGRFKLKDLTITSTGLPNQPTTDTEIQNLTWLAKVLCQLEDSIGTFTVMSAYRSHEVQDDVGAGAVAAGKLSFHEVGLAADIFPDNMTIEAYMGKILTSEWRQKLGEIILKKSQNTLHLSLPSSKIIGKIMFRESDGTYRLMSQDEIDGLLAPFNMSYVASSYGSNDTPNTLPDPSGGQFTDLFYGLYGRYEEVPPGSVDPADIPDYSQPKSTFPMGLALAGAVIAAAAAILLV